jgi:hypothetical protein
MKATGVREQGERTEGIPRNLGGPVVSRAMRVPSADERKAGADEPWGVGVP